MIKDGKISILREILGEIYFGDIYIPLFSNEIIITWLIQQWNPHFQEEEVETLQIS